MTKQIFDTRQHLLDAACKLFGEYGYNTVSTRDIAEKAHVNLGGIHYYFGSKKDLYEEVIKVAFGKDNSLTIEKLLEENPVLLDTPVGKAHAIYRIVFDIFKRHLFVRESWKRKLILREIFEPSPQYVKVFESVTKEKIDNLMRFFFMLAPNATLIEAYTWVFYPDTQVLYYIATQMLTERFLTPEFLEELYRNSMKTTARAMILLLDLPVPEILK